MDSDARPVVSVVIPTRNRCDLALRAIRSVLAQTYAKLECIVVDDASVDGTASRIAELEDPRLTCLSHPASRGASAARNTGIARANGKLLAFLDDDDEWAPAKLEKQVHILQAADHRVGLVYCWVEYVDDETGRRRLYCPRLSGSVFPHVFDRQRIGPCSSLVVRRNVIDEVGGFDEQLPRGNDGDFIRRVCRSYDVAYVPDVLVQMHVRHGYERITRADRRGTLNALHAEIVKLQKFRAEALLYPDRTARILAKAGIANARLGRVRDAFEMYRSALRLAPGSLAVYRQVAVGVRLLAPGIVNARLHRHQREA